MLISCHGNYSSTCVFGLKNWMDFGWGVFGFTSGIVTFNSPQVIVASLEMKHQQVMQKGWHSISLSLSLLSPFNFYFYFLLGWIS